MNGKNVILFCVYEWRSQFTLHGELGRDFGTSLWQLVIERYTNFPRLRKRALATAIGP
jgi:hypothetical protein